MIRHISIKNFAIIKNIDVDFAEGFSTITGETGAGKSIIIEAITMALGDRADRSFVRTGENKAVIQMIIELSGEDHILYREISKEGKSICKINGEIVTLGQQREFAKAVADVHGQYSNQSLLDEENHINLIDSFMKEEISPLKEEVASLYAKLVEITKEYNNLLSSQNADEREKEYFKYQLGEINNINPQKDEDTLLSEEIKVLENIDKISHALENSYGAIYENDNSALGQLMTACKELEQIKGSFDAADELNSQALDIYYNLEALSDSIRNCKENLPSSETSLDQLITRLQSIDTLKSKHGGTLDSVFSFKEKAELMLSNTEDREYLIEKRLKEKNIAIENIKVASVELSKKRKEVSALLENKISNELYDLNFSEGQVKIDFSEKSDFSANGIDAIELLIKTNKGDIFKPLVKIASGGEMSRVMLAFKNIISDYDNIPTIIFDEIDTGISGQTASVVGKKLAEIGKSKQVIAITHLPQVAALGEYSYSIVKEEDETSTFTTVKQLSEEERVFEIAKLLSGNEVTDSSLENARSLLNKN